jgi:hypothetical protein
MARRRGEADAVALIASGNRVLSISSDLKDSWWGATGRFGDDESARGDGWRALGDGRFRSRRMDGRGSDVDLPIGVRVPGRLIAACIPDGKG